MRTKIRDKGKRGAGKDEEAGGREKKRSDKRMSVGEMMGIKREMGPDNPGPR